MQIKEGLNIPILGLVYVNNNAEACFNLLTNPISTRNQSYSIFIIVFEYLNI